MLLFSTCGLFRKKKTQVKQQEFKNKTRMVNFKILKGSPLLSYLNLIQDLGGFFFFCFFVNIYNYGCCNNKNPSGLYILPGILESKLPCSMFSGIFLSMHYTPHA